MTVVADLYAAQPFWIWLAVGVLLLAVEAMFSTEWLLWPAVAAGLVALGVVIAVVARHWDEWGPPIERALSAVGRVITAVKDGVMPVVTEFVAVLRTVWESIAPLVGTLGGLSGALGILGTAWGVTSAVIGGAWEAVSGAVQNALRMLRGAVEIVSGILTGEPLGGVRLVGVVVVMAGVAIGVFASGRRLR